MYKINVIPYGNKVSVEEEIRKLIDRSHGGFERDIGSIDGNEGLLATLTQNADKKMEDRIAAMKSMLLAIYNDEAKAVNNAKDRRFVSHIQSLTPEQIDRIQCWFPADSLDVRYSLTGSNKFKPVERGSPGQKNCRTSRLHPFLW